MDWPAKPPRGPRRRRLGGRALIGGTGRVLIAAGLLLFGFVAYQLWGTGIQQARSQAALQDEFTERLLAAADPGAATPGAIRSPSTTAASATVTPSTPATPSTLAAAAPTTASSAPTAGATTTTGPRPTPEPGEPIARLVMPTIDVDQVVVSGVDTKSLEKAPGHYPDTPLPGEIGNAAIAGHRSTFGAPFERVDELAAGDPIEVTTAAGTFVYRVVDSRVVEPTEIDVIANTPDAVLTLTSCWPKFSADKRIIIRAALDPTAGEAATPPAPTLAPTTTTVAAAPDTGAVGDGAATTVPSGDSTGGDDGGDGPAADVSSSIDAFSLGWFSDDRAWGDVMAWGAVLTLLTLGAWRLSRRTRNWVGALAGLVPFLVALYFFYENAARLLPPSV